MKKLISIACALIVSVCALNAQDVNQATDLYNNGATELNNGNNSAALDYFKKALTMAKTCGEQGKDIVANCESAIPKLEIRVAKDYIKAGKYDAALKQLSATAESAGAMGAESSALEAKNMIPMVYMQKGNSALKSKDIAGAVEAYNKVLELNPENGKASLNLGQAYEISGNVAEAEKAYLAAAAAGQAKSANKKLANIYLRRAQQANKEQKYADAVNYAVKSNSFSESANANYIAGLASQNSGKKADAIKYLEKFLALSPNASNAEDVKKVIENLKK